MGNLNVCDGIWIAGSGGGSLPLITLYNRPSYITGSISYRTGDTAWQIAQGYYDSWNDTTLTGVSKQIQTLDYSAANPSNTLLYNNPFGNKIRFTDELGGTTFSNDVFIDNLTGTMYSPLNIEVYNSQIWNTQIDAALAYSDALGNSDYLVPPSMILVSLFRYSSPADAWDDWFPPVSGASVIRRIWSACTGSRTTTSAIAARGDNGTLEVYPKTATTTTSIFYRIIPQPTTPNP